MRWAPGDLENLLPVLLDGGEMDTLALLGVLLVQIEQVHIVIIAHIRRSYVVAIFAEAEGGDRSATLGQCHHVDSLRGLGIPDEDHWFKADLPSCDPSSVRADC